MPTHVQQQQLNHQAIQRQVCHLLGWDAIEYNLFMEKTGKRYLQAYMGRFPELVDAAVQCPLFWNYWRVRWMDRDDIFQHNIALQPLRLVATIYIYNGLHDVDELIKDVRLPNVVLAEIIKIKEEK